MKIQEWLVSGGSFEEGFELFKQAGCNRSVERYLSRKKDMDKLRYELSKFVGGTRRDCHTLPNKADSSVAPDLSDHPKLDYEALPAPVQQIYRSVVAIYRRMRSVHERMKLQQDDTKRSEARKQLIALEGQRASGWQALDRWLKDKILPAVDTTPTDAKSVVAARVAVTRNLTLLGKTTDQKRVAKIVERLRKPVAIILASGGTFSENKKILIKYGVMEE